MHQLPEPYNQSHLSIVYVRVTDSNKPEIKDSGGGNRNHQTTILFSWINLFEWQIRAISLFHFVLIKVRLDTKERKNNQLIFSIGRPVQKMVRSFRINGYGNLCLGCRGSLLPQFGCKKTAYKGAVSFFQFFQFFQRRIGTISILFVDFVRTLSKFGFEFVLKIVGVDIRMQRGNKLGYLCDFIASDLGFEVFGVYLVRSIKKDKKFYHSLTNLNLCFCLRT